MSTCSFIGCEKKIISRNFCSGHYEQNRRGKTLSPLRNKTPIGVFVKCSQDGCGKKSEARGMCEGHYKKIIQCHTKSYKLHNRIRCLKHGFGITLDEYNAILDSQNGVCAICNNKCVSGRNLAVDHDHETDEVRGLLCSKCNTAIGLMDDDSSKMARAIGYLEARKVMVVKSA